MASIAFTAVPDVNDELLVNWSYSLAWSPVSLAAGEKFVAYQLSESADGGATYWPAFAPITNPDINTTPWTVPDGPSVSIKIEALVDTEAGPASAADSRTYSRIRPRPIINCGIWSTAPVIYTGGARDPQDPSLNIDVPPGGVDTPIAVTGLSTNARVVDAWYSIYDNVAAINAFARVLVFAGPGPQQVTLRAAAYPGASNRVRLSVYAFWVVD